MQQVQLRYLVPRSPPQSQEPWPRPKTLRPKPQTSSTSTGCSSWRSKWLAGWPGARLWQQTMRSAPRRKRWKGHWSYCASRKRRRISDCFRLNQRLLRLLQQWQLHWPLWRLHWPRRPQLLTKYCHARATRSTYACTDAVLCGPSNSKRTISDLLGLRGLDRPAAPPAASGGETASSGRK